MSHSFRKIPQDISERTRLDTEAYLAESPRNMLDWHLGGDDCGCRVELFRSVGEYDWQLIVEANGPNLNAALASALHARPIEAARREVKL